MLSGLRVGIRWLYCAVRRLWIWLVSCPTDQLPVWIHRSLQFLEHNFVILPAGIIGGIVALIFPPMFAVLGFCFLLGLHRSGAIAKQSRLVQAFAYLVLAVTSFIGLSILNSAVQKKLADNNVSFAKLVASFLPRGAATGPPAALTASILPAMPSRPTPVPKSREGADKGRVASGSSSVSPPYLTQKQTKDAAGQSLPRTEPRTGDGSLNSMASQQAADAAVVRDPKSLSGRLDELYNHYYLETRSSNDDFRHRAAASELSSAVHPFLESIVSLHGKLIGVLGTSITEPYHESAIQTITTISKIPNDPIDPGTVESCAEYLQFLASVLEHHSEYEQLQQLSDGEFKNRIDETITELTALDAQWTSGVNNPDPEGATIKEVGYYKRKLRWKVIVYYREANRRIGGVVPSVKRATETNELSEHELFSPVNAYSLEETAKVFGSLRDQI